LNDHAWRGVSPIFLYFGCMRLGTKRLWAPTPPLSLLFE
jgi:hypothetical protein